MLDLIRKRHEGPAWIVLPEVANGTGGNVRRHADAIALGLWPSRGYEIHGYEIKISRGDVRRELNDPSKADAVGKFCDYWWLVVEDVSIIDGLVVPENWGILAPKLGILRVVRKAPKLNAAPVTRAFVAALTRKVVEHWVPRDKHEEFKKNAKEELKKELERDREYKRDESEQQRDALASIIKQFAEVSGVDLLDGRRPDYFGVARWIVDDIGEAVKLVREARERRGSRGSDAADILKQQLYSAERSIESCDAARAMAVARADALRAMLDTLGTTA